MFLSCWTPPSTDSNKPPPSHWSQSLPARRLIVDHMPSCVCFGPSARGLAASHHHHCICQPTLLWLVPTVVSPWSYQCLQGAWYLWSDNLARAFILIKFFFFFWWLCNQLNCDGSVYQFPVTISIFCINLSFSKISLDTLPKVFPFRFLRVYDGKKIPRSPEHKYLTAVQLTSCAITCGIFSLLFSPSNENITSRRKVCLLKQRVLVL